MEVSKRSRDKGKRGELQAAAMLRPLYPNAARASQYRGGKTDGCDIDGTPWHVEVEHSQRPSPHRKMRQAIVDAAAADELGDGPQPPLVLTRQNRGEWLATLRFEDFARFVLEHRKAREEANLARRVAVALAQEDAAKGAAAIEALLAFCGGRTDVLVSELQRKNLEDMLKSLYAEPRGVAVQMAAANTTSLPETRPLWCMHGRAEGSPCPHCMGQVTALPPEAAGPFTLTSPNGSGRYG